MADLFSEPLKPDPRVALDPRSIQLPKSIPGPIHGAQYVIEVAGPKSVAAPAARELLGPRWNSALGGPEVYVMSAADQYWRLMSTSDGAGSYDSISLAWDMVGLRGALSSASARQLLQTSESFGATIGRRAFPFPPPGDVDRLVKSLIQARESFDIGVEVILQGPSPILERDIWTTCAALGLDLSPEGTFVWRIPEWEDEIFAVAPLEEGVVYSLRNAQGNADHEALSTGFNLPRSPDPLSCLEAVFHAGQVLSGRLQVALLDTEGRSLSAGLKEEMRSNVKTAAEAMKSSGLTPGSRPALKLFES